MTPEEEIEALELEAELRRRGKAPPTAPSAAPDESPSLHDRARGAVKAVGSGIGGALGSVADAQQDAGTNFLKGASLGLDDEIANLAARAGATFQRQKDADDQMLSGGGESVLDSWRATEGLGDEARQERRAETGAASERSPIASAAGTGMGAIVAGMSAPGAQGSRLAQLASGTATGAVGGAGMGDAETDEDLTADAVLGGGLGAVATGAGQAAGALRRVLQAKRAAAPAVAAAPTAPAAPAGEGFRSQAADFIDELANEGPLAVLRKRALKKASGAIRPKGTPEATAPPPEAPPPTPEAPAPAPEATAPQAPAPIPDDAPILPPALAKGEVATDLRRATLGRRPTEAEIRDAVEAVAIRDGTTDIATLSNKIGVPTTEIRGPLTQMLQTARFRASVAAGQGASSQVDEAASAGAKVRDAKASAQSPIDNVSGRDAGQVAAVKQQEQWRSAFDNLPPEQRATFVQKLRQETGLPDEVLRQRLKMTKAEWRRTSFSRSEAASPVLRPKTKPAP